jgi:uncharacterized protein YjiS (DUF1127 family)
MIWFRETCVVIAVKDFLRAAGFRFRRWREDRRTWAALKHLDDMQLKEFGIHSRPADLTKREFP